MRKADSTTMLPSCPIRCCGSVSRSSSSQLVIMMMTMMIVLGTRYVYAFTPPAFTPFQHANVHSSSYACCSCSSYPSSKGGISMFTTSRPPSVNANTGAGLCSSSRKRLLVRAPTAAPPSGTSAGGDMDSHNSSLHRENGAVLSKKSCGAAPTVPIPAAVVAIDKTTLNYRLKVASFFFLWYLFNVGYNLTSKLALNVVKLPWTMAVVQLVMGIPYVALIWLTGVRKRPRGLTRKHLTKITPLALMHMSAHQAAVISIGAGAMGFVQIVKAAEPLFTCALSAIFLGQVLPLSVYATLIPVVGGVSLASMKELSFSAAALVAAMISNTCAASRSVYGKKTMGEDKGENMDAGNLYAVMTIIGSLVLAPIAYIMEGQKLGPIWQAAVASGYSSAYLMKLFAASGIFFYLYNEVAFYCLNAIHPVTHAIGNTMKRVVMIIVSIMFLNHKFTPMGALGGGTAVVGVMLYSISKNKYDFNKAAAALEAAKEAEEAEKDFLMATQVDMWAEDYEG